MLRTCEISILSWNHVIWIFVELFMDFTNVPCVSGNVLAVGIYAMFSQSKPIPIVMKFSGHKVDILRIKMRPKT